MHAPGDESGDALAIHLLGGFRVRVGTRPVPDGDWRLRKTKNLVKLLALAPGHRLHREQLMEVLWPDQDPEAAANNLHKAVYTARRALEPDLAPATPSRYLHLDADWLVLGGPRPVWVDVAVFEHAATTAQGSGDPRAYQSALDVYAGELLPEDRYEDWATGRRETLQALYLTLLLELAQLQEARGQPQAAIEPLRRVVASDPSHEEARVALMRLHAQAAERVAALWESGAWQAMAERAQGRVLEARASIGGRLSTSSRLPKSSNASASRTTWHVAWSRRPGQLSGGASSRVSPWRARWPFFRVCGPRVRPTRPESS